MILIVGLGNPGKEYENTRHNIGREILIEWQKKSGYADFGFEKKWNGLVSLNNSPRAGRVATINKFVILLPETFVNKSGKAVGPAARFYKIKPKDIIIIHDDADIELGHAKLTYNRSSAGHKGVDSVRRAIKTEAFWRLRLGIQPPLGASLAKGGKRKRVEAMKLVLQKFSPAEQTALKKLKKKIFAGLSLILEKGPEMAMNEINRN